MTTSCSLMQRSFQVFNANIIYHKLFVMLTKYWNKKQLSVLCCTQMVIWWTILSYALILHSTMHSQILERTCNKWLRIPAKNELTELQVLSEMRELVPTVAFHHHLTAGESKNHFIREEHDNNYGNCHSVKLNEYTFHQ